MEGHSNQNEFVLVICCAVLLLATVISAYANIQLKFDSAISRVDSEERFLYSRRYLVFGILLACVGGAMDLIVIAYIPMSIRSCFSSLSIPISVVLARIALNERISHAQMIGVMITVIGSMAAILFANHETSSQSSENVTHTLFTTRSAFLAIVNVPLLIVALEALRPNPSRTLHRSVHLLLSAYGTAFVGASVSLSGKFLSYILHDHGMHSIHFLVLSALMVLGSVGQVVMMSAFLAKYDASRALPLYQVINSVILSIFAAVIFAEPIPNVSGYVMGNLASFFGLWLLTRQSSSVKEKIEDEVMDFQPLMIRESFPLTRSYPKESFMII